MLSMNIVIPNVIILYIVWFIIYSCTALNYHAVIENRYILALYKEENDVLIFFYTQHFVVRFKLRNYTIQEHFSFYICINQNTTTRPLLSIFLINWIWRMFNTYKNNTYTTIFLTIVLKCVNWQLITLIILICRTKLIQHKYLWAIYKEILSENKGFIHQGCLKIKRLT